MPTLHEREREASPPALPYSEWLDKGSDNLRHAYVSVCPYAASHDVAPMPLTKIVDAIRTGMIVLPGIGPVDLKDEQEAIVGLYDRGYAEAEALNELMLRNILQDRGIDAAPGEVEIITARPKDNEKVFFFSEIKHAGQTYKLPDGFVWRHPKHEGKRRAADRKKKLPGVTYAACFQPQRKANDLVRATGLFGLDLDGIDDMNGLSAKIRKDPNVFLECLSITGSGFAVVVRGPVTLTPSKYSATYKAIAAAKGKEWGVSLDEVDPATSDICRLRFLSCDDEMYVNWDAVPLDVVIPEQEPQPAPQLATRPGRRMYNPASKDTPNGHPSHKPISPDMLREMLVVIPADDRQTWRTVLGATRLWGEETEQVDLAYEIAETWAKKSNLFDAEDQRKIWDGLNRGNGEQVATVGSIIFLAKKHGWKPKRSALRPAVTESEYERNLIILPSGTVSISDCAWRVFERATDLYWHGAVCGLASAGLEVVKPDAFRSRVERYGQLAAWRAGRGGSPVLQPGRMSADDARAILASLEAREILPPVANVLHCPVITERDGKPVVLAKGYHRELGGLLILEGEEPPQLSLQDAKDWLLLTVEDLAFQTPADKSRALAARITPALKLGGWLGEGSTPVEVMEANEQQSGKGWCHQVSSAIYNTKTALVAQREGGVGSFDESFGAAVASGAPFIGLDNVRGRLDSKYLESFITSPGLAEVRLPGRGSIWIDPRRHILQLTSNGMESTSDLAARSSICRIRKQPSKVFPNFPKAIRNSGEPLGAVFAFVREWHRQGKPRTTETRHAFHEWCQTLDWIVQTLLGQAPLMDGHAEAQERVSSPERAWLRKVANAVESTERLGLALTASGLAEVCQGHVIEIPGMGAVKDVDAAARIIGGLMRRLFARAEQVTIEGFTVKRTAKAYRKPCGDMDKTPAYFFEGL